MLAGYPGKNDICLDPDDAWRLCRVLMRELLMSHHKCLRCNGSKKYAPLGGIYKDCEHCKGVGYVVANEGKVEPRRTIADLPVIPESTDTLYIEPVVIKKKPGRKPGWNLPKPDTLQCAPETATITE